MKLYLSATRVAAATIISALLGIVPGQAAAPPTEDNAGVVAPPVTPVDDMVVTQGHFVTGGTTLNYTVHTGTLPILDNDTGRLMARMFIIAYTVPAPDGAPPRPLTFIWNGGPGSNSSQTHLVGFGPKGFRTPQTYPEWKNEPTDIDDRPETWLATSDLVFVDPIGTGYSRAITDEDRDRLYTTLGDRFRIAQRRV